MRVLHTVDNWQRRMEGGKGPAPLQAADSFYQKAYKLVTAPSAKKAFDIHSEDPRLRERLCTELARPELLTGSPADRGRRPVRHGH
jgi:hypothetical protein